MTWLDITWLVSSLEEKLDLAKGPSKKIYVPGGRKWIFFYLVLQENQGKNVKNASVKVKHFLEFQKNPVQNINDEIFLDYVL